MNRTPVIAANWKMNKTIKESREFLAQLVPLVNDINAEIFVAVPFTAIYSSAKEASDTNIVIGAQNMNDHEKGAFTGEISGEMLKEAGAQFVILGHSERREIFHESNSFINKKVKKALEYGLQAVLCVGESAKEREDGVEAKVIKDQLTACLDGVELEQMNDVIIAYEPVWAIGTGKTATPEMAEDAHKICRDVINQKFGKKVAEAVRIIYGGSVKPESMATLMKQEDIDGVLVGGASLEVTSFAKICRW